MNYELFTLEQFIESITSSTPSTPDLWELSAEIQRISAAMKINVISSPTDRSRLYIREHQYGLLFLFKNIEHSGLQFSELETSPPMQEILILLQALLEEVETRYQGFFDADAEVPLWIYRERSRHMKKSWDKIYVQIADRDYSTLLGKLESILFDQAYHGSNTYRKLYYIEEFLILLDAYLKNSHNPDLFELILFLCSVDFNNPDIYSFCGQFIEEEKASLLTAHTQAELLAFIKKRIEQNNPITAKHYEPSLPSLKNSLLQLINSESDYLNMIDFSADNMANIDVNLKVAFTVKQLAIFTKLLSGCGILISEKPIHIHQYVSNHFSTPDAKQISQKSFKNAYYSNASADLDKVLEKVTEMLVIGQRSY